MKALGYRIGAIVLLMGIAASCTAPGRPAKQTDLAEGQAKSRSVVAAAANEKSTGEVVYNRVCKLCHALGVAGAPKLGDKAGWQSRMAQGMETLISHAIEGYQGSTGIMPPKGGNPSLSDDEVAASVAYMVEKSKAGGPAAQTTQMAGEAKAPQEVTAAANEKPTEAATGDVKPPQEVTAAAKEKPTEAATGDVKPPQEVTAAAKEKPTEAATAEAKPPQEVTVAAKEKPAEAATAEAKPPQEVTAAAKEKPAEAATAEAKPPQEVTVAAKEKPTEAATAEAKPPQEVTVAAKEKPTEAATGEAVYNKVCKLCHAVGIAGAPKPGDKAGWQSRMAQGMETLVSHAIEGYQGSTGVMPAKGGNPSLSDDEVAAAVAFMVDKSR